jgi:tetratricopeptide (TPR) repeat protein
MRCRALLLLLAIVCSLNHESHAQTPSLAVRHFEAGEKKLNHADWFGAVDDFTRAIELNAQLNPAKWQKKKVSGDQAFDNSQSESREIAVSDSFTAYAYLGRAVARYYLGDFDAAITDYDRALRIKPTLAEAYSGRGAARTAKGDPDGALLDFQRALAIDDKLVEVYNNRGYILLDKKDFPGAIEDFNRAIELKPTVALAHQGRGLGFMKQGHFDLAVRDFTRAIELNPAIPEAYANRGLALMVLGREREANADLQKSLELNPALKTSLEPRIKFAREMMRINTARLRP